MELHEKAYKELKNSGCKGWGGINYDNRMSGWEKQLTKLFENIKLEGKKVLELGCGSGDVSIKLSQRGYEVMGIDISTTAIEWANQKSKKLNLDINFISGNVSDNSIFQNKKYDLIIDGNCLHCLFDDARKGFFNNLVRLINKKGIVFISSAIIHNETDEIPNISEIKRCFVTKESIIRELESRNFELVTDWITEGTHIHYYGIFRHETK